MKDRYDIAIVGAGMVGATLACALGPTGLRIAVVEARLPPTTWPEGSTDLRVSAISTASQRIFTALDVWPAMTRQRVSPFREMYVWDACGHGAIHFDSADIGEARLGHIIENRVIQAALMKGMRTFTNIDLLCPATLTALERENHGMRLHLADKPDVITDLVVGADGSHSKARQFAGIGAWGWDYRQKAIVATVSTQAPHRDTAWQRFLPEGPLAFLPLSDGTCSIVWSTSCERADELLAMDEKEFLAALGAAFDHRLGRVLSCGPRAAFPLRLQHARAYIASRLALIGDAAHTIHPLAGQGVNLGLQDAAALVEVLGEARARGRDIGARETLRRYERWRKGDNLLMMGVMEGFNRLFRAPFAPLRWLRNTGLSLTDAAPPIKRRIMIRAMGLEGDQPALARPPTP